MDLQLDIKIDDFNAAMEDMQRRLGSSVPKRKIIDHEVGKILEKALKNTKAATKSTILASAAERQWITLNGRHLPIKGPLPRLSPKRGIAKTGFKYPEALWGQITAKSANALAIKMAAIDWAKKSWLALAWQIGVIIKSGGAEKATTPKHKAEDNVRIKRDESGGDYSLMIANDSPLMRWTGGGQAFFGALAGRIGYYNQNLAHGVFDDLSQVAKKYPGLEITIPPAAPDTD